MNCLECKEYNHETHDCPKFCNVIRGAMNELREYFVPVVRCKDCKHQRKEYREDKRRKDGGYNIYWCDLVDGYAPLGFDDEYCSWAERKEE